MYSTTAPLDTVPRLVFRRGASRAGHLPQSEMIGHPPIWLQRFGLDPLGTDFFGNYAKIEHKTAVGSIVTLPLQAKVAEAIVPPPEVGLRQLSRSLGGAVDSAFIRSGSGLKTGFRDLDHRIGGLQPAGLIILASRRR